MNQAAARQFLEESQIVRAIIEQTRTTDIVTVLDPDKADPPMLLQLGAAIAFGKPLLLLRRPGQTLSPQLLMAAQELVDLEDGGLEDPANQAKLAAAIARIVETLP